MKFGFLLSYLAKFECGKALRHLEEIGNAFIEVINFSPKFNRKKDTLQIRYSKNGNLAKALQGYFFDDSYVLETIAVDDMVSFKNTIVGSASYRVFCYQL